MQQFVYKGLLSGVDACIFVGYSVTIKTLTTMTLCEFIIENKAIITREMVAASNIGRGYYAAINPRLNIEILQAGWNYEVGQIPLGSADSIKQAEQFLYEQMQNEWFPDLEERFNSFWCFQG